jgi:magnesium-protoporphyrin O-methyltransferase
MSCAQCEAIEAQFGQVEARKKLRRFQRRGPDKRTRLLIDALRLALDETDARGAVLLDVGGGVGAIHHELLNRRLIRAIHLDASTAHLTVAREETERRGHGHQVEFVYGDFVVVADRIPAADLVTLDRVICCYDDMERLVGRSAAKATRLYGAVFPRKRGWMRLALATINLVQRLKRTTFRVFLHDPAAIDAVLRASGLERRTTRRTLGWEVAVYQRQAGASSASTGHSTT